jgi:hypothetical protein
MSHSSDFLHILSRADEIMARLGEFAGRLNQQHGLAVSDALRQMVYRLFIRFANVRALFVSETVSHALRLPELTALHGEMRMLDRIYSHDRDTISDFLKNAFDCLATQALMHADSASQDEYGSRAFLSIATAFISGLKGFPAPSGVNSLDSPAAASAKPGTKQASTVAPRLDAPAFGPPPSPAFSPPPAYTTVQRPIDSGDGGTSVTADIMARQTAAGYRAPGPLIGGLTGGGAEGIDLTPCARKVLFAQQLLHGIRAPGTLTSLPPPGEDLPPVSSYPSPFQTAAHGSYLPYPGYVSPAYQPASAAASPYTTVQRPLTQGSGGVGGGQSNYSTGQSAAQGPSDELYIPYSAGMLGSFSPYRALAMPPSLTCYECGAMQQHYGNECPTRFVRVRGEAPPGWKIGPGGSVTKDPAAWNGSELTDAARAQYRDFVAKFPLVAHAAYSILVDEITGAVPAPPRRPLPRPSGGGRRK